ncbi:MAG: heme A synthase [Rhodobacterales bacterium]|nr:MAG: heme A synthase [Rhodobacterales bacterium]
MTKKRAIFEEVSGSKQEKTVSAVGVIERNSQENNRGAIQIWLKILFTLVVVMILVGGLTRLTDSGLSITEWRPITGALPPLSSENWLLEFEKYKQIPEYELQNKGMSLSEFKFIYWWEWGHRQLGRVIGLVWLIGFITFFALRKIPNGWTGSLLFVGILGGLQGAVGWWMVSSGLTGTMLDVASYRLATHLGLAFVILGYLTWFILLLGRSEKILLQSRRNMDPKFVSLSTGLLHLTFLQILVGALVAGIDAGRNYVDWPLMAGGFLPPDPFELSPWWRNFFEDDGLVQFMHRMIGYTLFLFCLFSWRRSRSSGNSTLKFSFNIILAIAFFQMVLGIATVMYAAPWEIAIFHQFGAILLWVFVLRARFLLNILQVLL